MGWIIAGAVVAAAIAVYASLNFATVRSGTVAVTYKDGKVDAKLAPGRHRWFDPRRSIELRTVSTLRQSHGGYDVSVMTRDQFSFRIRFAVVTEVTDALAYAEATAWDGDKRSSRLGLLLGSSQSFPELHDSVTATVVEEVAKATLEDFLADPSTILPAVRERIAPALPGAEVREVLITAITMPPEIRKMFTEVERARRDALASLEKARGEQASLRALANAARTLTNNP